MQEYIERLKKIGKTTLEAVRIYEFFMLHFDKKLLDYIVDKMEKDYVEKV